MKNLFILGVARAGKSTLAQMLKEKYPHANLIHADSIKNAIIRNPYNTYGLQEKDDTSLFIQHAVAKIFSYHIKYSKENDINIFEGSEISPFVLHEYFPNEKDIIFLGHGKRNAEDIFRLCNTYDKEDDWTFNLKNSQILLTECEKWEQWNNYLINETKKYGYEYIDTYIDRNLILQNMYQKF